MRTQPLRVGILHTAFVGDLVLLGLLVEALYQAGLSVVIFTKGPQARIFLHDERLHAVVPIHKGSGFGKVFGVFRTAHTIHKHKCQVLLVPHRSLTSTLAAFFSRVPQTVGFCTAAGSFLYKKTTPWQKHWHECHRLLLLAQGLIPEALWQQAYHLGRPVLRCDENFINFASSQIENFIQNKSSFFIVAPGSIWPTKKYPPALWAKVIFLCLQHNPCWHVVVCGSPGDKTDCLALEQAWQKLLEKEGHLHLASRFVGCCGVFPLDVYSVLVSKAQFVLSGDSSPVHFAAGWDVPAVALFGPTDPSFGFGPTSTKYKIVRHHDAPLPCQPCSPHGTQHCPMGHHHCMLQLNPEKV